MEIDSLIIDGKLKFWSCSGERSMAFLVEKWMFLDYFRTKKKRRKRNKGFADGRCKKLSLSDLRGQK